MIIDYDNFSQDEKESIRVNVPNINKENDKWGSIDYSDWKNGTTEAFVNYYDEFIHITSLNDLKLKINNNETLKKLLAASSINTDNLTNLKIVDNTNIGIVKNDINTLSNLTLDLIHINVQANDNSRWIIKFDLGIPVSNINYKLKYLVLELYFNNSKFSTKTNIDMSFGIDSTIENFKDKEIIIDSQQNEKETVNINELLTQLKWSVPSNQTKLTDGNNIIQLDSNKIGKDLGIYNVHFSNPIDSTSIDKKIGTDSYEGMSITFDITPKNNFYWEDGTRDIRKVTTPNLNVKIKDSRVNPWCRVQEDNRYGLMWEKIYPNKEKEFPKTLKEVEEILKDKEKFNELWNLIYDVKEYKNDFRSIKMHYIPSTVSLKCGSEESSVYWFQTYFRPSNGHMLIDKKETDVQGVAH